MILEARQLGTFGVETHGTQRFVPNIHPAYLPSCIWSICMHAIGKKWIVRHKFLPFPFISPHQGRSKIYTLVRYVRVQELGTRIYMHKRRLCGFLHMSLTALFSPSNMLFLTAYAEPIRIEFESSWSQSEIQKISVLMYLIKWLHWPRGQYSEHGLRELLRPSRCAARGTIKIDRGNVNCHYCSPWFPTIPS